MGGGIAGLALAAALDPGRHEVVVHEAQPDREGAGGALSIWPAAMRALGRIGARARVEEGGWRVGAGALRSLDGRALAQAQAASTGSRRLGAPPAPVMVPRPALLSALRDALPTGVRLVHEQVTDPSSLDADLVIGADGVRSRVRALVHPPAAERLETPYVALRGSCGPVTAEQTGEYWGPGILAGVLPLGPGQGYWFTTHRSTLGPEPLDVAEVVAEAREHLGRVQRGVAPILTQVLDGATGSPATTATRIWVAPPLPRYVRGRYAVIGDAAHAMTPNLGRGGNDAIIDAVTLASAIAQGRPRAWQARRLPVTQAARLASGGVMRVALMDRGHRLRDGLLAAIPTPG